MTTKTLMILRHAKALAGSPQQGDHERPLAPRGQEDAQKLGTWLAGQGRAPAYVLCSGATRTRQTLDNLAQGYGAALSADYSDKLYMASSNEMMELLRQLPAAAASAMLIGHNPGMHQLALKLAHSGDERLLDTLAISYPTCALAIIAIEGEWRAGGKLVDFITPKMLGGSEEE